MLENDKRLLTIVGQGVVVGDIDKIEGIISMKCEGARALMRSSFEKGKYRNFVDDPDKIKTLILFSSGSVYTSTYSYKTICERLRKLGVNTFVAIPSQLFLNDSKIETILEKDATGTFEFIDSEKSKGTYMDIYQSKSDKKEGQRIRTYIVFDSGHVYPSTINLKTILKKVQD